MPFVTELLKYKNAVFVETGTFRGDTLDILLQSDEFNYTDIYSLELSGVFFDRCSDKYTDISNVTIIHSNSKI